MNALVLGKIARVVKRKTEALVGGSLYSVDTTLAAMALRPFELHLELTNICNASCIFCPYQYQERATGFMSDAVFEKAVNDYVQHQRRFGRIDTDRGRCTDRSQVLGSCAPSWQPFPD